MVAVLEFGRQVSAKPTTRYGPTQQPFHVSNMVGRMITPFDPADYSIAVLRNRKPHNSWRWEINGAGKSIPVERSASHFQTMAAATKAGKAALQRFVKLRAILTD